MIGAPHPLDFFAKLRWLDGRLLLDTIEPYRRTIFESVLYTLDGDRPRPSAMPIRFADAFRAFP
jgi:hypothetical protein